MRSPAFTAFVLVVLLFHASAGCSASMYSSREVNSSNGAAVRGAVLVGPATRDVKNVYLPAVLVLTPVWDGEDVKTVTCSGALIDSRTVVTAGHCVCRFREVTPSADLNTSDSPKPDSGGVVTRAGALKGVVVTNILDSLSPCGEVSVVTTLVYGNPGEKPVPRSSSGRVVVHPDIELIAGAPQGESLVVWNHADVAVIRLDTSAQLNVQFLSLPKSEVKLGDPLIIIGYGPAGSGDPYGARRSGENAVTTISRYEPGNVVFGADAPPSPDGGVPAYARPGDSGGACVNPENPNVLIGIVTMGKRSDAGDETSYFTSIYPHAGWLSGFLQQDGPAADAGVIAPGANAGVNVGGADAGLR